MIDYYTDSRVSRLGLADPDMINLRQSLQIYILYVFQGKLLCVSVMAFLLKRGKSCYPVCHFVV